ncbi:MAG TPA: hypothetical protein VNI52_12890 [Sphingobacteriaceae bacterium]|nr:hypothetical protein [Sphingobacteriaceae bacterium]
MKVSEKSNGAVRSTEERREEANQVVSVATKAKDENPLKEKVKEETPKKESPKAEISRSETTETKQDEQSGQNAVSPVNEIPPIKPVLNLEATLKVVEDLHRRSIQRDNLLNRINQLDAFEIALIEEGDELESNHFQGCKLMIVDDKNRQFITTTSGLIKLVAEFIHNACLTKLGEIEANIVFPRA